jgi:hypothetical protein
VDVVLDKQPEGEGEGTTEADAVAVVLVEANTTREQLQAQPSKVFVLHWAPTYSIMGRRLPQIR